jgi:chorismate mutase/prephenate dehydratase
MDIKKLRKEINKIDNEILKLLNRRAKVAIEIGKTKKKKGILPYRPARERDVINLLTKKNKGPLSSQALQNIYREIMSASVNLQKKLTIAYLGPEATYTHEAATKKFGSSADYKPLASAKEIFSAVEKGTADFGVVPVENSTEGIETHTLDMFVESDLKICDEILLPISHCLLSKSKKNKIKKVYSKDQALAQCRIWLQKNLIGVPLIEVYSTAHAAKLAAEEKSAAAIASELASRLYKLPIVGKGIEDFSTNVTRFLVIGKEWSKPTGNDKVSLMFSLKDKVGALHSSLKPFYKYDINLTKIESRPSKRKLWEYYFFVDLEGHCEEKRVKQAMEELKPQCIFLKVLGSYPKG